MFKKYIHFFARYISNFNNILKLAIIFFSWKYNNRIVLKHKNWFKFIVENRLDLITIKEVMNDYNILSLSSCWWNNIIIDIWWHKWYFSCFLAYLNNEAEVYCYEPDPLLFEIINNHIKLNNLKNCFVYNAAISWNDSIMDFWTYWNFNSNAWTLQFNKISHNDIKLEKVIKVKVIGINNILTKFQSVSFLKIDCEWEEFNIFHEISEYNIKKIENVICEFHEFDNNRKEKILNKFLKNNFLIQKLYYILNENKQWIVIFKNSN